MRADDLRWDVIVSPREFLTCEKEGNVSRSRFGIFSGNLPKEEQHAETFLFFIYYFFCEEVGELGTEQLFSLDNFRS